MLIGEFKNHSDIFKCCDDITLYIEENSQYKDMSPIISALSAYCGDLILTVYFLESNNKIPNLSKDRIEELRNYAIYNFKYSLSRLLQYKPSEDGDIREYILSSELPDSFRETY